MNNETFEVFKKLEYIFRQYQKSMCNKNHGFKNFLVDKFFNICKSENQLFVSES